MSTGITVNMDSINALSDREMAAFMRNASAVHSAVDGLKSSLRSVHSGVEGVMRGFARMGDVVKGVLASLMNVHSVVEGLESGVNNLYNYARTRWKSFADALDSIAVSAAYLRNALGAMAAPLLSSLAPAIEAVTNRFVGMFNVVNQVFSRLTGASTYRAARRMSVSWGGVSRRISRAASALRRYVTGFDQLNIIYSDARDRSGGFGGGGGGGAGGLFEERAIDAGVAEFADALKAAFLAADWQTLGALLGDKVNALLAGVDWAGVGQRLGFYLNGAVVALGSFLETVDFVGLGSDLAGFLEAALSEIDPEALGATLERALSVIPRIAFGFFSRFDWKAAGVSLSGVISGFFKAIDWDAAGAWIDEAVNGLLDFGIAFLNGFDADGFADGVGRALERVDWAAISEKLLKLLGAAMSKGGALASALSGLFDGLPAWVRALLGGGSGKGLAGLLGQAHGELGVSLTGGEAGAASKTDKKQLKETRRNTRELVRNTKKRAEVDVNYEGAGFDVSGDRPRLDVGVAFRPEGAEEGDDAGGGLLGWLQALLDPGVSVEAKVGMVRDGWESFKKWMKGYGLDEDSPIGALIDLVRNNFDTVMGFLGIDPKSPIAAALKLLLDNADSLLGFLGIDQSTPIKTALRLLLDNADSLLDFLGIPEDSPIRTFIELLLGDTDPEADKVLNAGGTTQTATVATLLTQGATWVANAWTALTTGDRSPLVSTLLKQGATWVANAWTALTTGDRSPLVSALLRQGSTWIADAWTALTKGDHTTTTSAALKQAGTWIANAWTALTKGDHTTTTQAALRQAGTWITDAWTALTKGDHTTTTQAAVRKSDTWGSDAWTALTKGDHTTITHAAVKKADTWGSDAWTALTKGDHTTTTKVKLVKSSKFNSNAWTALTATGGTIKKTIELTVTTVKSAIDNVKKLLGLESGGVITGSGRVLRFAAGGAIMNSGRASWWDGVNKYAAGTSRAHGTVFVAGEAGPEIMGHVNGRTEILNKSQLADAIYAAVVSGMAQAVNALGRYLAGHMTACTNAIVATLGAASAASAYGGLDYRAPAMATGGILPYDVAMQIARSTEALQRTLDDNNEDLIQAMASAVGNAAASIVQAMQRQAMQGGARNAGLTSRQVLDDINRQTLMYGASPLKGV